MFRGSANSEYKNVCYHLVKPPPFYLIYWDRRSPGTCRVAVVLAVPIELVAVQLYVPASSETVDFIEHVKISLGRYKVSHFFIHNPTNYEWKHTWVNKSTWNKTMIITKKNNKINRGYKTKWGCRIFRLHSDPSGWNLLSHTKTESIS